MKLKKREGYQSKWFINGFRIYLVPRQKIQCYLNLKRNVNVVRNICLSKEKTVAKGKNRKISQKYRRNREDNCEINFEKVNRLVDDVFYHVWNANVGGAKHFRPFCFVSSWGVKKIQRCLGFDGFLPFDDDRAVLYRPFLPSGCLKQKRKS